MIEDSDLISFYKKQLEDFQPVPPMESWEAIERQLDIDDVWQNVKTDLDHGHKSNQISNISKISEVAVLVALLCWLLIIDYPAFRSSEKQLLKASQKELIKGPNIITTEVIPKKKISFDNLPKENNEIENSQKRAEFNTQLKDNSQKSQPSAVEKIDRQFGQQQKSKAIVQGNDNLKNILGKNPDEKDLGVKNNLSNLSQNSVFGGGHAGGHYGSLEYLIPLKELLDPKVLMKGEIPQITKSRPNQNIDYNAESGPVRRDSITYRSGFSFGIGGAIKNHWLLNNTTYRGLSSEELTSTLPSFGKSLGILMSYDISTRVALQTELVYSEEGQSYKDYIGGKYQKKTTALAYYSLSAIAKYRLHPLFAMSNASSSNVLLGIYYGRLQKAEEILENNVRDLSQEYKEFDTGIFVGYEYEYILFNSFTIVPGLRFRYGLTNIYSGDGRLPSSMNVTKNSSLNLNIAIKYNFSSK